MKTNETRGDSDIIFDIGLKPHRYHSWHPGDYLLWVLKKIKYENYTRTLFLWVGEDIFRLLYIFLCMLHEGN